MESERDYIEKLNKNLKAFDSDNMIMESMSQWIINEHEGKSFSALLEEMGFYRVAIYGYGYLGKLLEKVLKDSNIEITCIMDMKYKKKEDNKVPVGEKIPDTDVIIVTSPYYYDDIEMNLKKLYSKMEIHCIDEFLFQM